MIKLREALHERNKLVHGYFWQRAVEFTSPQGRDEMLEELAEITDHLESLDAYLSGLTDRLMEEKGVTQDVVDGHLAQLLSGRESPHDPRTVPNPVVLTAACEWKVGDSVNCAILFTSEIGNLVLGERGLCFGPQGIPSEHLRTKAEFVKALPATVNPKPRKAGGWNYVIPLTNGHELRVRPGERDGRKVVRFGLRQSKSSGTG